MRVARWRRPLPHVLSGRPWLRRAGKLRFYSGSCGLPSAPCCALPRPLHEYVEDFADIGFVRGKRQLSCRAIIIRLRRSIFTSSLMLSGIVRAASVPGRSEYLNIKEESEAYRRA